MFAPPGKALLVTARAVCAYSCYDTKYNRTNCLVKYIKHLLDNHKVYIRDKSLTVGSTNVS